MRSRSNAKARELDGIANKYLGIIESSYKGGRNECFAYGQNRDRNWYDFDLCSAYTTALSGMGTPS